MTTGEGQGRLRFGIRLRRVFLATLLALVATNAGAYETDQLTGREVPLPDILDVANAEMNRALAAAVADTNAQTACRAPKAEARRILARKIYKHTAARHPVTGRGPLKRAGYGRYAAWIETQPIPRREFIARGDVYSGVTGWQSLILHHVGPCSTVNLGGVLLGSDKVDHFLAEGFTYLRASGWGAAPERALELGTTTERSIYGELTSKTFSFADLAANWDGYLFYAGLLEPGSALGLDAQGCVEQTRPFDWREWVDWRYDEVLNPSVHTRPVQAALTSWLQENDARYCASYHAWGGADYRAHIAAVLAERPAYVLGWAPPRQDPFDLAGLCGDAPASPAEGAPPRRELRRQVEVDENGHPPRVAPAGD